MLQHAVEWRLFPYLGNNNWILLPGYCNMQYGFEYQG